MKEYSIKSYNRSEYKKIKNEKEIYSSIGYFDFALCPFDNILINDSYIMQSYDHPIHIYTKLKNKLLTNITISKLEVSDMYKNLSWYKTGKLIINFNSIIVIGNDECEFHNYPVSINLKRDMNNSLLKFIYLKNKNKINGITFEVPKGEYDIYELLDDEYNQYAVFMQF